MFESCSMLQNKFKRIVVAILLFSLVSLYSATISAATQKSAVVISPEALTAAVSSSSSSDATPTPLPNPILDYKLDINAQSAIVVEMGRGMRLYLKNSDMRSNIPAASKIMTAVIAIETIPLDTKITISKVAASQEDSDVLSLVNGEKYSLEYLLYGLLLMDNNAAAVAIAEQISGEEVEFIKLMNNKALSYKMENTIFTNVTGAADAAQYTTVSDVARLVRYALTFPTFETILKTRDIPFFLSTNQAKHVFSNIENAWSLVDTTTGAMKSTFRKDSSFVVISSSMGINTIMVGSTTDESKTINDISTISSSIFSHYEFSTLVTENQSFPPKSIAKGTDVISLKFNQEITYVHPKDDAFIRSTTYEENAVIDYPFLTTKSVAKVVFELMDGTKITADLYPVRTVWGKTNYIQKLIMLYNSNPDIGLLIVISLGLLVLLCIINLVLLFVRLHRNAFINVKRIKRTEIEKHAEKDHSNGSQAYYDPDEDDNSR